MLEQTDVLSQPPLLLLIIKTLSDASHVGSLFLHHVGPTGTIRGPLRVTSIRKPHPNGAARSRGSRGASHHTHPIPDIALSLLASPPSHANIILQNITTRADEEGQFPLLPKGPRVSTSRYYDGEHLIHFPRLLPFSISHRALNHCRLWEMLEP